MRRDVAAWIEKHEQRRRAIGLPMYELSIRIGKGQGYWSYLITRLRPPKGWKEISRQVTAVLDEES